MAASKTMLVSWTRIVTPSSLPRRTAILAAADHEPASNTSVSVADSVMAPFRRACA